MPIPASKENFMPSLPCCTARKAFMPLCVYANDIGIKLPRVYDLLILLKGKFYAKVINSHN